jgi:abnormal spindle-like microcephaly-associated protein
MLRYPDSTPCPLQSIFSPLNPLTKPTPTGDTEDIEKDTTQIQAQIRRADPRRTRTQRQRSIPISIYEDAEENPGSPAHRSNQSDQAGPQNPLLRGAKLGGVTGRSFQQSLPTPAHNKRLSASSGEECARLQTALGRSKVHGHAPSNGAPAHHDLQLRRNPRRRTIYIPSDDTSVLTIHPGWHNTNESLDAQMNQGLGLAVPDVSRGLRKGWRKPTPTSSRRVALQPTPCSLQEFNDQHDRPGSGPGKENLPPGFYLCSKESNRERKDSRDASIRRLCTQITKKKASSISVNERSLQLNGSHHSMRPSGRTESERFRQTQNNLRHALVLQRVSDLRSSNEQRDTNPTAGFPDSQHTSPRETALGALSRYSPFSVGRYPILREDIVRPEIYDEEWLENRESALLRLVNHLFAVSDKRKLCLEAEATYHEGRKRLLQYYQNESNFSLYRRVQASLHSGNLRAPQAAQESMSRLREDLGFQRLFTNLWLDTYNLLALTATVEVVMGRDLRTTVLPLHALHSARAKRKLRNTLTEFILTCLLRNPAEEKPGRPGSAKLQSEHPDPHWQQTMLKSLMIVYLLDKSNDLITPSNTLFLRSSGMKSSQEVLTKLGALLLPAASDIKRSLGQLGYHVSQIQHPLDDYDYLVGNLAVDLRDGVRLTRLIELLLYQPPSWEVERRARTTVLPHGEILAPSQHDKRHGVLSQKLVFPAIGRAQKTYNVELALCALRRVQRFEQLLEGLQAEDIVNGHRERTLKLLWMILGQEGGSGSLASTNLASA